MGPGREAFERFVSARWSVPARLAALVTGDPARADRQVTITLAQLGGRWARVVEDGDPSARSPRALVED